MPRLKSAIKRVKTSERNRLRNVAVRSKVKTLVKKVQDLVSKKDAKSAIDAAKEAFAALDRAATKRVYHLNNAAKKKSRISKWLKTLESSSSK